VGAQGKNAHQKETNPCNSVGAQGKNAHQKETKPCDNFGAQITPALKNKPRNNFLV